VSSEPPRLLSGPNAAAYLGISHGTFSKWVASGVLPRALLGTRKWDRKAIDVALDKAAGLIAPSIVPEESPLEVWRREDAARQALTRTSGRHQAAR
jgi:hypothetical protein